MEQKGEKEKGTEQQQVALVGDRHQAVTVNNDTLAADSRSLVLARTIVFKRSE